MSHFLLGAMVVGAMVAAAVWLANAYHEMRGEIDPPIAPTAPRPPKARLFDRRWLNRIDGDSAPTSAPDVFGQRGKRKDIAP